MFKLNYYFYIKKKVEVEILKLINFIKNSKFVSGHWFECAHTCTYEPTSCKVKPIDHVPSPQGVNLSTSPYPPTQAEPYVFAPRRASRQPTPLPRKGQSPDKRHERILERDQTGERKPHPLTSTVSEISQDSTHSFPSTHKPLTTTSVGPSRVEEGGFPVGVQDMGKGRKSAPYPNRPRGSLFAVLFALWAPPSPPGHRTPGSGAWNDKPGNPHPLLSPTPPIFPSPISRGSVRLNPLHLIAPSISSIRTNIESVKRVLWWLARHGKGIGFKKRFPVSVEWGFNILTDFFSSLKGYKY